MTLLENLEKLNFSHLEAQIYLALLGSEPQSAYQLAKKIEIARPSIYNALEHMLEKGLVDMVPGKTALYAAQEPAVMLGKIRTGMTESLQTAEDMLREYRETKRESYSLVFKGFDTAIFKAKEILKQARHEVYVNADFGLMALEEEFASLCEKKVRRIVFSFYEIEVPGADTEFYSHHRVLDNRHEPSRLMLAVDDRMALVADCSAGQQEWTGTVSNNRLTIRILSEHIHNDIYLLRLREKYGAGMYGDLMLGTEFERRGKI